MVMVLSFEHLLYFPWGEDLDLSMVFRLVKRVLIVEKLVCGRHWKFAAKMKKSASPVKASILVGQ